MTAQHLSTLYDYSMWANARLFRAMADLSDEAFTRTVAGSYGSIRNTLVHVMSTEWGWTSRCGGPPRPAKLNAEEFPTLESVASTWKTIEGHVQSFLSTLDDDALAREVSYPGSGGETRTMPLGELMHHAILHAMHHRGQVALLLRELGVAPGNMDLLFYYAETQGVSAW
ncbi:MAG: DinB family protein [Rubricoccaceae bacterium]